MGQAIYRGLKGRLGNRAYLKGRLGSVIYKYY